MQPSACTRTGGRWVGSSPQFIALQFQEMIQAIYAGADSARALEFLEVLKTLIENYQAQDMLGMADCLKGLAEEMILCLEAEENQSPEK